MSEQNIQPLFRLRVEYVKAGRLAYLGHLEVLHTIERIIRRASLPYAVTQGFSPHMRAGFSSALPVGTSSRSEWYDVFLTSLVPPAEALQRLQAASPEDLMATRCGYVDVRTPALTAQITRVLYRIELSFTDASAGCPDVSDALAEVIGLGRIPYARGKKSKVLDVDRMLVSHRVTDSEGCIVLELDTRCDNEGALRPEILVAAIDRVLARRAVASDDDPIQSTGIQRFDRIARYRVERRAQLVEGEDGGLIDPLCARS